jgi:hypothetical protein
VIDELSEYLPFGANPMPFQAFPNLANHARDLIAIVGGNRWVRLISLTIYYVGILLGLILLYGRGDFSTPPFVYQRF